jgi:hypothetical protein
MEMVIPERIQLFADHSVGPLLVGCPWLLIQYIHSYHPYLEVNTYICNLRMCHDVLTRYPSNMGNLSIEKENMRIYNKRWKTESPLMEKPEPTGWRTKWSNIWPIKKPLFQLQY